MLHPGCRLGDTECLPRGHTGTRAAWVRWAIHRRSVRGVADRKNEANPIMKFRRERCLRSPLAAPASVEDNANPEPSDWVKGRHQIIIVLVRLNQKRHLATASRCHRRLNECQHNQIDSAAAASTTGTVSIELDATAA
jgi:hypothetical protein